MNPGILTPPTQFATMPRGLLGSPTPVPMIDARRVFDPDAERYLSAVERADGRPLEEAVRVAIGEFVIGCKEDGTWGAIRACCLLMGARTLAGALTPLVGGVVTNFNFVSADYNRRTGLLGNGSKRLSQPVVAGPWQDNHSLSFITSSGQSDLRFIGGFTGSTCLLTGVGAAMSGRSANAVDHDHTSSALTGFSGLSRSASSFFVMRHGRVNNTASIVPNVSEALSTFGAFTPITSFQSTARIAFYHGGNAMDLTLMDARATALYNAIGITLA